MPTNAKHIILSFTFFICFISIFCQEKLNNGKTDTLFIANKKYPLLKVKPYHDIYQDGPILLPSEYKSIEHSKKELKIPYKTWSDSSDYAEVVPYDNEETQIQLRILKPFCDTIRGNFLYLNNFVDTIYTSVKSLSEFKPYIKSNGKKIFFSGAHILSIKNNNVYEYLTKMVFDGGVFVFWNEDETNKDKSATFVLSNLYYIRNNATYYLNREFVILLK